MFPIKPNQVDEIIFENCYHLEKISCPIDKCTDRILRQDIFATNHFPPFDRSMMDGYAVRFEEIQLIKSFKVIAEVHAGVLPAELGNDIGNCVEIMTGAVVPSDANCIIPYEQTKKLEDGSIQLLKSFEYESGQFIHKKASDHAKGDLLLKSGSLIGSRQIAVAASCGFDKLKVSKKPSVTILTTGDELVHISQKPKPFQMRRTNDCVIASLLNKSNLHAKKMIHLVDDFDLIQSNIARELKNSDFLIISGGVSKGVKDFVPKVLDSLKLKNEFHGVLQKPGKPFGFWSEDNKAVFALPGNPLSVLVCMHRYVLPALIKAQGQVLSDSHKVRLNESISVSDKLTIFMPVKFVSSDAVMPMPAKNSGDLVSVLFTDGFIELKPNLTKRYEAGSQIDFYPWL